MRRFLKWGGIALLSLGVVGTILYFTWPQLFTVSVVRYEVSKFPHMDYRLLRFEMPDISAYSPVAPTKIDYDGLTLVVPWEATKAKEGEMSVTFKLKETGKAIVLANAGGGNLMLDELLRDPRSNGKLTEIQKKFGLTSDYDLKKIVYNITPDDLSVFDKNDDAIAKAIFVMLKASLQIGESPSQNFETEKIKGFVSRAGKMNALVELYTNKGNKSFSLILPAGTTDQEIAFILSSAKED